MDCGGKRSATPLFAHAESFRLKPRARPRESAVAAPALPAHSTTICTLGSASANPPAAGGASGGTAGRGKIRARPGLGAKHPPPQSAGQTIRTATKNSFSFSARLRTKYRGSPAGLLTLFCHLLNPRAGGGDASSPPRGGDAPSHSFKPNSEIEIGSTRVPRVSSGSIQLLQERGGGRVILSGGGSQTALRAGVVAEGMVEDAKIIVRQKTAGAVDAFVLSVSPSGRLR